MTQTLHESQKYEKKELSYSSLSSDECSGHPYSTHEEGEKDEKEEGSS